MIQASTWEQSGSNVVSFTGDDLAADVLRNEILDDLGFEYDQGGYYQHNFSDFEPSTDDEYDFLLELHLILPLATICAMKCRDFTVEPILYIFDILIIFFIFRVPKWVKMKVMTS